MAVTKKIPLFWWSERILMGKDKENYGDLLSKYIVEKISGKHSKWVHPKKQAWYQLKKTHYLAAGSVLAHATKHSVVWGTGIVNRNLKIAKAKFLAVRGPETRNFLIQMGYDCPEVFGDPAILLPYLYSPQIEKEYELGIIPHYVDFKIISEKFKHIPGVKIIDMMTLDIEKTTDEILACRKIISSSLHGVIVPHAYGIPALWIKFSEKVFGDNIKYSDYFKSVGISDYKMQENPENLNIQKIMTYFQNEAVLPNPDILDKLKKGLLSNSPFSEK